MQITNSNIFSLLLQAYYNYDKDTLDACLQWLSKEFINNRLQLTKEQQELKRKIPNDLNEMILDALLSASLKKTLQNDND